MFLDFYEPLLIGVTSAFSIKSLKTFLQLVLKNPTYRKYLSTTISSDLFNKIEKEMQLWNFSQYNIVKNIILVTKFDIHSKCFQGTSKSLDFINYILYYSRLIKALKFILLQPLIKALITIQSHGDIYSKTLKALSRWINRCYIMSFNGNKFDNVLLHRELTHKLLNLSSRCKVFFQRNGGSLINLCYTFPQKYTTHNNKKSNKKNFVKKSATIKKKTSFLQHLGTRIQLSFKVCIREFIFNNISVLIKTC